MYSKVNYPFIFIHLNAPNYFSLGKSMRSSISSKECRNSLNRLLLVAFACFCHCKIDAILQNNGIVYYFVGFDQEDGKNNIKSRKMSEMNEQITNRVFQRIFFYFSFRVIFQRVRTRSITSECWTGCNDKDWDETSKEISTCHCRLCTKESAFPSHLLIIQNSFFIIFFLFSQLSFFKRHF